MDVAVPLRSATADWLRALERTADVTPASTRTLAVLVEETAAVSPEHPALIGRETVLRYGDLAALMRRVARWALAQGMKPGDRVALMMTNTPDYAAIWLGLSRIGVVTALINTRLSGDGLAHCLREASPKHIVVGPRCLAAFKKVDLGDAMTLWTWGCRAPGVPRLDERVADYGDATFVPPPQVALRDPALLIYTSGTTGLPKAARVSHHRVALWSRWFAAITEAGPDDRLYDCLPMYHSVGGVVAVGSMLAAGGSVIVRESFSSQGFWPDVAESGATIFQYIGELCRYLVAAPPVEGERRHTLRLCCGNGLREDVWTAFVARFGIPRVLEFYAATEGSFSLFNLEGKPGAIGRIPSFMAHRSPIAIVRHDPDGGTPPRGPEGFCSRCAPEEPGEAIGKLGDGAGRFEGYTSASESERKVLRDVFVAGDRWFRTGDLMVKDAHGFFRFVDRLGDTFRWKGENVSTAEVEAALLRCPGVADALVYGVEVPGADGRAGMAALVVAAGPSLAHVLLAVADLPRYARPMFVRLCKQLDTTETFRPKKAELIRSGYDAAKISDPLYVLQGERYLPLDATLAARIATADADWLRSL